MLIPGRIVIVGFFEMFDLLLLGSAAFKEVTNFVLVERRRLRIVFFPLQKRI